MAIRIMGLGKCIPRHCLTQEEAFDQAKEYCGGNERKLRALKRLYEKAEINSRSTVMQMVPTADFFPVPRSVEDFGPTTASRMAQYESQVTDLAVGACENAFADLQEKMSTEGTSFRKDMIRNLVTVTCTGFSSPGFDIALIDRLGLSRDTARTQIGFMGCHGALNGLRVANALQLSNQNNRGSDLTLLCAAEICSIHFHYGWQPESLLANSLFADGAGALVLGGGFDSKSSRVLPKPRLWSVKSSVSHVVPDSLEAMSWKIGDNGFSMTLSSSAPELIKLHLLQFLNHWLQSLNLRREDISAWAIHPG